jgi:capsular exopolysaccharide synthesis family protein
MEKADPASFSFYVEVIDDKSFFVKYVDEDAGETQERNFNENFEHNGISLRIVKDGSRDLASRSGEEYLYSYKRVNEVAKSYAARLNATWAEEGAGVINLSITGSNSQKEVDFLGALIKNYEEYDLNRKNVTAFNAMAFIDDQLEGITDSLRKAEIQLEKFKNKNVITDLTGEASRIYQKIEGLEIQRTELLIKARYYDYLVNYITNSGELDQLILPTSVGIEDNILSDLISEVLSIQTEIKLLTKSGKLVNPSFLSEKKRRLQEIRSNILESVKNQKSTDKIRMEFLTKGTKEYEKQLSALPIAERQLVNIKRNYALQENLYVFLLQKRAEAGISKASNLSDISVVNPPSVQGLVSPNTRRNYILGFAIGLTFPFLLIVLFEVLNTRIQSQDDIQHVTNIPIIGGVGHKRTNQNVEVFEKPKSAISESFRALRSNLNYFLERKEKGVFLVTSSISGEGKTFTSINLASVFALSGKNTLIIGADMRRPKIYTDFDLPNTNGLSNFLAGLSTFDEVVQKTPYDNLYLVSGGPIPPNPSELILGTRMEEFITLARKKFDYIFIDSPPIAIVTDAFVLSGFADHTLFIVRQNYTPKGFLTTINNYYADGKIKQISIVLNDIYKSGPGYGYGYGYNYGYGYAYAYGKKRKNGNAYYEE